jgi:hypothetical protein
MWLMYEGALKKYFERHQQFIHFNVMTEEIIFRSTFKYWPLNYSNSMFSMWTMNTVNSNGKKIKNYFLKIFKYLHILKRGPDRRRARIQTNFCCFSAIYQNVYIWENRKSQGNSFITHCSCQKKCIIRSIIGSPCINRT